MRIVRIKTLFLSNLFIKVISLIFGYSFWYIATFNQPVQIECAVPLSFYDLPAQYQIQAPEKIIVTVAGKRSDFYALDYSSLAIHINGNKLFPGEHGILLKKNNLFLPESISLLSYKPSNIHIIIKNI